MIEVWQDWLVVSGIIAEIGGFIMILKSEGLMSSAGIIDSVQFSEPAKVVKRPRLHDWGIILVIIGLAFQVAALLL